MASVVIGVESANLRRSYRRLFVLLSVATSSLALIAALAENWIAWAVGMAFLAAALQQTLP